jgi:LacI family transcriptional regulator
VKKHTSIIDIAKELNVAVSTVSSVLNGKAQERRIGNNTKKRILDYAAKSGYKPNQIARSLRTGKSNTIGMLVEDIANPFFAEITSLIEKKAATYNYELIYSSTENDFNKLNKLITTYKHRQVDGFIIAPCVNSESKIQELIEDKTPFVLFDRHLPNLKTNNVLINNYNGTYEAAKHLYKQGFSNIGFITTKLLHSNMKDRLRGYQSFMEEHTLKSSFLETNFNAGKEKEHSEIATYLLKNSQLDALIFSTNYIALSGLGAIKEMQKRHPKKYGIISFDDNTHFDLFNPSITSIAQPIDKIANEIIRILLLNMKKDNQNLQVETRMLEPKLIIRDSTKKIELT